METCHKSLEKEPSAPFPWRDHTKRKKIKVFENTLPSTQYAITWQSFPLRLLLMQ